MNSELKKHCIIVLGMHRSGTSAFCSLLNNLGISAGTTIMPPSFDNPKGFFENLRVVKLNDQILEYFGLDWSKPQSPFYHSLMDDIFITFEKKAKRILTEEYSENDYFFIKDPRLCYTLPFWQKILDELYVEQRYYVIIRNPNEIAQSLQERNAFHTFKSLMLTASYQLSAEKFTRGRKRAFIDFNRIVNKPDEIVNILIGDLDIEDVKTVVAESIDPSLQHYKQEKVSINNSLLSYIDDLNKTLLSNEPIEYKHIENVAQIHFDLVNKIVSPWLEQANFIKILYSTNKNEYFTSGINLVVKNKSISQNIKLPDGEIKSVKLITLNKPHILCINALLINQETINISNIKSNAIYSDLDNFYFASYVPFIEFNIRPSLKSELLIDFSYIVEPHLILEQIRSIKVTHNQVILGNKMLQLKEYFRNSLNPIKEITSSTKLELNTVKNEQIRYFEELDESISLNKESLIEIRKNISELKETSHNFNDEILLEISDLKNTNNKLLAIINDKLSDQKTNASPNIGLQPNEMIMTKTSDSYSNKIQTQKDLIHKQHLEIQKLKQDFSHSNDEIINLRNSISYRIGQCFVRPPYMVWTSMLSFVKFIRLFFKLSLISLQNPKSALSHLSLKSFSNFLKALGKESNNEILNNYHSNLENENIAKIQNPLELDYTEPIILYISPNLPDYDTSSGGKRATRMLELLNQSFQTVVFTSGNRPLRYIDKLRDIGCRVLVHGDSLKISKEIARIDSIIFAWYYTLHDHSHLIKSYPLAKIIVDTVDVHWVREERSIGLLKNLTLEKVEENKKSELISYENADVIWAVTTEDKNKIKQELPDATVHIVSNIHDIEAEYEECNQNNLLFIGGFNHYPNVSSIKMISNDIFPKIKSEIADAQLIIAGANAQEEVIALGEQPGIKYLGYIEEEEIPELYKKTKLAIAPLTAGAGIKGKICEAISFGKPVATNSIGNEGINLIDQKEGLISDNPETLTSNILNLMRGEYDISNMVKLAQNKLNSIVGPSAAKKQMSQSLCSEVSICIVTWNRLALVQRCIESIEGNTIYPHYKILVHSNGCSDGTQQYLEAAAKINPRIIPILSETNDVFVRPNNDMMQMYSGNDVVLVNNDVYVTMGWLTALRKAAYSSNKIGIVGSKILYPDGRLQEFGSELYHDGTGRNIGKWQDPNEPQYQSIKRVGYVSGCSMYIKSTTIEKIGVFDDQFHPCYCEDSDYAYTAWEHNIQTIVTPESIIYHDEGGTSGTDEEKGFKAYQKINFDKFLKKHKTNLKKIQNRISHLNV